MRRLSRILLAALVVGAGSASYQPFAVQAASPDLVISQVYGGGGNAGATFTHDYVELFNRGTTAVSLAGLSIQYASATGTGHFGASNTQLTELPSVTLAPGRYFLVQQAGGATGKSLPAPDLTDPTPINLSGTDGKVALVSGTTTLGCNGGSTLCTPAQRARIIDLVGYGNANFFEGAGAGPKLSATTAAIRAGGGCVDTDSNAADFTAGLPTPRNSSNLPQSCAGDAAPAVASTTPANTAVDVAVDATISVTFSEPVAVSPGWYRLSCTVSGTLAAAVSGGPTTFTLDPSADFAMGETCTVDIAPASVTDLDADDPPNYMTAGHSWSFTTVRPPTYIRQIQGASHVSPLAGQVVSRVPGVVTATRSSGFYLQDPSPDADPATSEGIFVFTSSAPTAVSVGDSVMVGGTVSEFRPGGSGSTNLTITQITSPTITKLSIGNALPAAVVIGAAGRMPPASVIDDDSAGQVTASTPFDPQNDGIDFYESLEGMRVQINDAVAVGPGGGAVNFGEIPVLADGGAHAALRTARGGIVVRAGDFNPERIFVDNEIVATPTVNVGDRFGGPLVGVVDYSFGNYKVQLTAAPSVVPGGLQREITTPQEGGQLAIATFNVENLHAGDNAAKFSTLAEMIVTNLRAPDLIALEEVQDNNGPTSDAVVAADQTYGRLIGAIQAAGGPTYSYRQVDPQDDQDGGQPGGNIRVGFLFRTDRGLSFVDRPGGTSTSATSVVVGPGGPELSASPGRIDPTNAAFASSRKPLASEFVFQGSRLFVVANHFNSKGGDHPLFGRYQPPTLASEAQRVQQATVVGGFVRSLLAADPAAHVVVLGDLNDFEFSPPLQVLKDAGLHALIEQLPANERYSYVFEGNSQTLDHVMVSASLLARLVAHDVVHVNAEFAVQASDHDPQVSRLLLDALAPTITFSGAGTYDVDQQVTVTCTATDNDGQHGSGVASTTCPAVASGPAWTFAVGSTTFTASATDRAGNTAQAAASVTIAPTFGGLMRLTESFVADRGLAESMTAKLRAAQAADRRGDAQARQGLIGTYVNEVEAQRGKAVPSNAQADALIRFAQAL